MIYIKLRTAPGVTPYEELDLTNKIGALEPAPSDHDAMDTNVWGEEVGQRRALRRNIRVNAVGITAAQVATLRRWKHDRIHCCFSPNYNDKTVFYSRFARNDPFAGVPVPMIGPTPTFARGATAGTATYLGADGRFHAAMGGVPRYESTAAAWDSLSGIRLVGTTTQYMPRSRPTGTGTLRAWGAGTAAAWDWTSNLPSMYADAATSGCGLFTASAAAQYIDQSVTVPNTTVMSAGVWVRGEGTFSLNIQSGATGGESTGTVTLSSTAWTLLKIEGFTTSATTLVLRLICQTNPGWCAVSCAQVENNARITNYIDNISGGTTTATITNDDLFYASLLVPTFDATITAAFEVPPHFASGKQGIFGVAHGASKYLCLRQEYSGAYLWWWQKNDVDAGTIRIIATPPAAGTMAILAANYTSATMRMYLNGSSISGSTLAGLRVANAAGLRVGWDAVNARNGFAGTLLWLRIDEGPRDGASLTAWNAEHTVYVPALWGAEQRPWTRMTEGRVFKIDAPEHELIAGTVNAANFTLKEVRSYRSATTEAY